MAPKAAALIEKQALSGEFSLGRLEQPGGIRNPQSGGSVCTESRPCQSHNDEDMKMNRQFGNWAAQHALALMVAGVMAGGTA